MCPYATVLSIDNSRTNFNQSTYQEVSMVLQRLRLNERDFYFSFKEKNQLGIKKENERISVFQDASESTAALWNDSTKNNDYYEKETNISNREVFFSIMCGIEKRFLTKEQYYRGFTWMNLFTELADKQDKRWVVSVATLIEQLPKMWDAAFPPIGMMERNNYPIYKSLPREIYFDSLIFLSLENYPYKFGLHKLNNNELINETLLKIILNDYGMKFMPDTVIDIAKKGFDIMRRRQYLPSEVIKYMVIVHAAAGEFIRNNEYEKVFYLQINNDYSRRFPTYRRRFMSSPLV